MKIFYVILGILLVVLGGLWAVGNFGGSDGGADKQAEYFGEQLTTLGVADGFIPIEGFDAGLLMGDFPGLTKNDFINVETLEGHYELQGGELVFVRDQAEPISSAERTVSTEGYGTLLENLSNRFEIEVKSNGDVDEIISKINISQTVSAKIGKEVSAYSTKIMPIEIVEDSRCPIDVECIQAGKLVMKARVESNGETSAEYLFELYAVPLKTEVAEISLVRVEPNPESGKELSDADYEFYFRVVDRS